MPNDRIVAIGLLSQRDLEILGDGFNRCFPVEHDDLFDDLLAKLDRVEASPMGKGVILTPTKGS